MDIEILYKIYKSNPKICTDTRKIKEGGIFFALRGDKFNGNRLAIKAIDDGCILALVDEK